MYKIVNYDWNQSHPKIFSTFIEAFQTQQIWDPDANIEYFTDGRVDLVWSPEWENITFPADKNINTVTQTSPLQ